MTATAAWWGNHILRFAVLIVGLCLMSLGIALSVRAGLGTTPVSTAPLVAAEITGSALGTTTIWFNIVLVILQIAIRRRKFPPLQFLQLPVALMFGLLIDAAMHLTDHLSPVSYLLQWLWCALGILVVGVGVAVQVTAQSIMLPGEGLSLAVSQQLFDRIGAQPKFAFGNVKIIVDTTLVVISALVALVTLGGLVGVREGTVAAALLVGVVAKHVIGVLRPGS